MRKLIVAVFVVAFAASSALAQSQQAPTLRIVSEDGNRLPSDLLYGNTKVKPLRLRPGTNVPITIESLGSAANIVMGGRSAETIQPEGLYRCPVFWRVRIPERPPQRIERRGRDY